MSTSSSVSEKKAMMMPPFLRERMRPLSHPGQASLHVLKAADHSHHHLAEVSNALCSHIPQSMFLKHWPYRVLLEKELWNQKDLGNTVGYYPHPGD